MDLDAYLHRLGIESEAEQLRSGVVVAHIKSPPQQTRRPPVDAIAFFVPQRAVEVESRIDGRTTRCVMRRGDISLTPPLIEIELRHEALDAVVGWITTAAIVSVASAMAPAMTGKLGFRVVHQARDMLLSSLATELSDPFCARPPTTLYRDALRTALMGRIIRRYRAQSSELQIWGASREDARIRRTLAYLDGRSTTGLDIAQVARHVGVSPSHLRQVFKAATGETIFAYLRRQRLQLAGEMLKGTELSIAEIAARCGYSSASHFTKAFVAATKRSPGVYRAALQGNTRKRTRSR